ALELSQVVIVVGETGSGKTTQCPNFILEAAAEAGRGGEVAVVCTQPRRIAAVSVAERVAEEPRRADGAQRGLRRAARLQNLKEETRLLFCTTGVLLQQLNVSPDLHGVTHVVVDEAHERSLHTDFLLALLREVLQRRADLRVVVMSATLEQGLFQEYFSGFAFDPSDDLPVVHIAGRTHPLTVRYLGDALEAAGLRGEAPQREALEDAPPHAELEAWVRRMHPARGGAEADGHAVLVSPEVKRKADFDLIAGLCAAVLSGRYGPEGLADPEDGAVLIFLPGYVEIDRCLRVLRSPPGGRRARLVAAAAWLHAHRGAAPRLPATPRGHAQGHRVHEHRGDVRHHRRRDARYRFGTRPGDEVHGPLAALRATGAQEQLSRPSRGQQNSQRVSLGLQGACPVAPGPPWPSGRPPDHGARYNPRSCMSVFSTVWVSQAAARQRAGRASRTRPGVCWRLYEADFLEARLPAHTLCEMRRTCLEDLVLQLRLLELGDRAGEFLQQAPEPPAAEAIAAAVQSLVSIGALVNAPGLPLTPLGFHLAHMPVDARVGKMLVYGALCCCLAPVLTIAACLSHRSPFARSFNRTREDRAVAQGAGGALRAPVQRPPRGGRCVRRLPGRAGGPGGRGCVQGSLRCGGALSPRGWRHCAAARALLAALGGHRFRGVVCRRRRSGEREQGQPRLGAVRADRRAVPERGAGAARSSPRGQRRPQGRVGEPRAGAVCSAPLEHQLAPAGGLRGEQRLAAVPHEGPDLPDLPAGLYAGGLHPAAPLRGRTAPQQGKDAHRGGRLGVPDQARGHRRAPQVAAARDRPPAPPEGGGPRRGAGGAGPAASGHGAGAPEAGRLRRERPVALLRQVLARAAAAAHGGQAGAPGAVELSSAVLA
ncbi:unnamed protein product, partial [Prorocentrum cordatum]